MGRRSGEQRPVIDRQASGFEKVKQQKRKLEEERQLAGSLNKFLKITPSQDPPLQTTVQLQGNPQNKEGGGTEQIPTDTGTKFIVNADDYDNFAVQGCNGDSLNNDKVEVSVNCISDRTFQETVDEHEGNASTGNTDNSSTFHSQNDNIEDCDNRLQTESGSNRHDFISINYGDPFTWPRPLLESQRELIIKQGPVQLIKPTFPKIETAPGVFRGFNADNYVSRTKCGELLKREWLLYSEHSNTLYCFACCLFLIGRELSSWSNYGDPNGGFSDFAHQGRGISIHENSHSHFSAVLQWKQYLKSSENSQSLENVSKADYRRELSFWKNVLRSILEAVLYLAKNNLAFRGSSDKIGTPNCGNFLSLIELLSHFYSPLELHIRRMEKGRVSYMSPKIQNEFISLTARVVRKSIIEAVQERKYFSILFDATPDTSHKEQLSQIIRTVNISTSGCFIEESFIDFIHFDKKKGLEISKIILAKLKSDGIDIKHCRGQGYDNGANMSGIYNGVQAHIKEANEFAVYMPCVAHSLNLVGQNAASKVLPAKLILGQIQSLYVFFSSSTERWNTLKPHVHKMLKSQSLTRWSSKADAVSAICEDFKGILDALQELINSETSNSETLASATAHLHQVSNFRFILGITIWNSILGRINFANVAVQAKEIDIGAAGKHMESLHIWLLEFRKNGYKISLELAKEKALPLGIEEDSGFAYRSTRNRIPARYRDSESVVVEPSQESNISRFEREFFLALVDKLILEFQGRFTSLYRTQEDFGFLWGKTLADSPTEYLEKAAADLALKYNDDLSPEGLVTEIGRLRTAVIPFLKDENLQNLHSTRAIDILNILTRNNLANVLYNCHTAIRIFLTLPVSVASNERSFSKLKLIKNYLRSTMGQERLSDLAILSIEHEKTALLSFDTLIHEFATAKCRRVPI